VNLRKDHYPIGMITRAYAQVVVLVPQSHYLYGVLHSLLHGDFNYAFA